MPDLEDRVVDADIHHILQGSPEQMQLRGGSKGDVCCGLYALPSCAISIPPLTSTVAPVLRASNAVRSAAKVGDSSWLWINGILSDGLVMASTIDTR